MTKNRITVKISGLTGTGKTTVLKIIARALQVARFDVYVNDDDPTDTAWVDRDNRRLASLIDATDIEITTAQKPVHYMIGNTKK